MSVFPIGPLDETLSIIGDKNQRSELLELQL